MKNLEKVRKILIHCTASDHPRDDSLQAIDTLHRTPENVMVKWGGRLVSGKSFDMVGYQWVITKDGKKHKGRSEKHQGAHCLGRNHDSISICLTGNERFTLAQFRTLFELLGTLKEKYDLTDDDIYGHYHFNNTGKTCPNFMVNL